MTDAGDAGMPGGSEARPSELFRIHVRDPQAPRSEEVERLVAECERRQKELEVQNEQLRTARRLLEAYRDRYIDLYDFAPLGYVTLDQDGYVQEVNLTGAELLGVSRNEITGFSFRDYVAAEDREAFQEHVRTCAAGRREVTSELRLMTKNGRTIAAQLRSMPVLGPQEDALCKTAITDLTDRKRAEQAIEKERSLLRTLIDNLPDFIYVKDREGRFLAANLPAARIMGAATPADLLGKTDFDFYPPERAAEYHTDEQAIMQSGEPLVNKDEPHVAPDGTVRSVLTTKVPIADSEGRIVGLVGISRDITERKRVEQSIIRLNEQLESANRDLEAFTSAVCHDLRRPLQIISGFSQLLSEEYAPRLDEAAREYLGEIGKGVDEMANLIEDLLKLSRASHTEIQRQMVDVSEMVESIADGLRRSDSQRAVEWVVREGVRAEADPQLLRVALENLLENAWKFTSKHAEARIEFGVTQSQGQRAAFIRDDGAGFDMRLAQRLFGAFQRMHSAEEFEGNGIGLATVERIVRAHGGQIWAEGAVEEGATFFFTLPKLTASGGQADQ